jgi:hypothetical protein
MENALGLIPRLDEITVPLERLGQFIYTNLTLICAYFLTKRLLYSKLDRSRNALSEEDEMP